MGVPRALPLSKPRLHSFCRSKPRSTPWLPGTALGRGIRLDMPSSLIAKPESKIRGMMLAALNTAHRLPEESSQPCANDTRKPRRGGFDRAPAVQARDRQSTSDSFRPKGTRGRRGAHGHAHSAAAVLPDFGFLWAWAVPSACSRVSPMPSIAVTGCFVARARGIGGACPKGCHGARQSPADVGL